MEKKVVLGVVFLLVASVFSWAQQSEAFSVAYWVSVQDSPQYERRISNAFVDSLEQNEDFRFVVTDDGLEADIHVVIRLISIPSVPGYAAAVSYTPIFAPVFTNANAATVGDSMSDMTWLGQQASQFVVDQLYILMDTVREENSSADNDDLSI